MIITVVIKVFLFFTNAKLVYERISVKKLYWTRQFTGLLLIKVLAVSFRLVRTFAEDIALHHLLDELQMWKQIVCNF